MFTSFLIQNFFSIMDKIAKKLLQNKSNSMFMLKHHQVFSFSSISEVNVYLFYQDQCSRVGFRKIIFLISYDLVTDLKT